MVAHVIKRAGHSEPYVDSKLYDSLERAALSVRTLEGEAALLAERVSASVTQWVYDKIEITSRDLRELASLRLRELHPEAAYAYDTHDLTL